MSRIKRASAAALKAFRLLTIDAVGIAGMVSISYGAWRISEPWGFIIGGFFALSASALLSKGK